MRAGAQSSIASLEQIAASSRSLPHFTTVTTTLFPPPFSSKKRRDSSAAREFGVPLCKTNKPHSGVAVLLHITQIVKPLVLGSGK